MILHKIKILILFAAYGSQWPIFKATSAKSTKLDGQQRPPWSRIRRLYRWRDKSLDRTHLQWWKVSCTNSDGMGPEISKTWKSRVVTKKSNITVVLKGTYTKIIHCIHFKTHLAYCEIYLQEWWNKILIVRVVI